MFNESPNLVVADNLNFSIGDMELRKQILCNVNLRIKKGEILILTGPSGSGKTTLLTLIGALRKVEDGYLEVLSNQMCGASEETRVKIRRKIGFVFQSHNLLRSLTVGQNIRMSLEMDRSISEEVINERVEQVLKAVGLSAKVNSFPDNLSGGQKQRVAVARALVANPALVLADEPTAALDSKAGRDIVELMQVMSKEKNCTVIIVTHDNRILDIADRIVSIDDGRIAGTSV